MVDGDAQIVLHRHAGEQPAAFGHDRDAVGHHAVRLRAADRTAVEAHHLGRDAQQPHDRFEQRRLAGAVGADQRDDLAGGDLEIDAVERLEIAIAGDQAMGGEQRRAHASIPI